jgi:3-phosphoshikimate 1-carboxyvinyltransferase
LLPLLKALESLGARVRLEATPRFQINVQGPLKGGRATVPGNVSSQFISGLLLAAPLAKKDVSIRVNGRTESHPYVDMTLSVMKKHGIDVYQAGNEFVVRAPQEYQPTTHLVPGDFSSSSFLLAAAATAGDMITIFGLGESSGEPDAVILDILPKIGARVKKNGHKVQVEKGAMESFEFDASDHPDLVPVLEVLACNAKGISVISGVGRLRYKESNRLKTIPEELRKMGANISFDQGRVVVEGPQKLVGQKLSSHGDHRVAMACTVASLTADGTSLIHGAETVSKSYPTFFEDLSNLGVKLDVE